MVGQEHAQDAVPKLPWGTVLSSSLLLSLPHHTDGTALHSTP